MIKYKHLLYIFLCVLNIQVYSQSIRFYTVDRELSSSLIHNNFQDKLGNIWIATEDGLNRYDGAKFSIYKNSSKDEFSIMANSVHCICEDAKRNLFFGTSKGIQLFDHATDKFFPVPIYGKNNQKHEPSVRKIAIISDGSILVGTSGFDGMYRIEEKGKGKFEAHAIKNIDLKNKSIGDFYEDHDKNLWISTENGELLKTRNFKIIKRYFTNAESTLYTISSMCEDSKKNLYIGTQGRGIFIYDKKKDSFESIEYSNPNLTVMTLYPYDKKSIYIGTNGYGLKILDVESKKIKEGNIKVPSFYLDNSKVHTMIKDHAGNLWIGFFQRGLMMVPNTVNKFKYIGPRSNNMNIIGTNSLSSIYHDKNGRLWVGTDNDGLYVISNNKQVKHIKSFDKVGQSPTTVISTFKDSNNDIWIGTLMSGIFKMSSANYSFKQINEYKDNTSNLIQKAFSFSQDHDGRLWIGTKGDGLFYLNLKDGIVKNINIGKNGKSQLENRWINVVFTSNDNKLYIGTCDGIECFNLRTLEYEPLNSIKKQFPHIIVFSIYEDKQNTMWLGTSIGLMKLSKDRKLIGHYDVEDGLSNSVVSRIEVDNDGNLWLSTNYGLNKFNTKNNTFINFYSSNGLQGNEFNRTASTKDDKGNLYFGGINGISYFNPRDITTSVHSVKAFISDIYLQNKPIRKGMKSGRYDIIDKAISDEDEVNLDYDDNSFTIEFSSLDFNSNEHICYQYSVNNEDWVSLQTGVNSVSFSGIPAGEYDVRYRAKNYDNYSEIKSIKIIIHPAWYLSNFAKVLYALFFIGIIMFIIYEVKHYYKVQQEILKHVHAKEIDETKLQFFINISHEIRTPMSLIIGPLQKLISSDKDVERQKSYKLIYNNSRRILQLINQLMDLRKIDKGQMPMHFVETEIIEFVDDIYKFFQYKAVSKEIQFRFLHKDEKLNVWVDPKNFDKIIFNLLSNAFKYTPYNGAIDISLEKITKDNDEEVIRIIVWDNGESIKKEDMEKIFERFYQSSSRINSTSMGTGIGLHITNMLVNLHHGSIRVENNEEGGCQFIVEIPYGCKHLNSDEIAHDNPEVIENESKQIIFDADTEDIDDEDITEKELNRSKSHYKIMVVEDDENIRNYISNEFSKNYHIIESCNGKEALALILSKKPDLVISDVMMPDMDGITLCKKIKLNVNINYIPVILLTAKCRDEDNIEGLNAGADAYITKPFNIDVLHNTIDNLLKNREVLKNCFTGSQEQEERQPKFEIKNTDNKLLDRIMNVINKNISNPELSVDMIASEVGISRVHLHRKLKELTNQTTRDLIRNTRLKQAVSLLESKQYNVSEVALMTGFSNITIFSRAFKELYGLSPMNYINNNSENDDNDIDLDKKSDD